MESLSRGVLELLKSNEFSDITLVIHGRAFPAHRVILAANSAYFRTMFRSQFGDSSQSQLTLHDVNPTVFESVLQVIYGYEKITLPDIKLEFIQQLDYFQLDRAVIESYLSTVFDKYLTGWMRRAMEWILLLEGIYLEGIPEQYRRYLSESIDLAVEYDFLSILSDYNVLAMIPYRPKNLLEFHRAIEKLEDPELYQLINYELFPPELRPREGHGPIGTLEPLYPGEEKYLIALALEDHDNSSMSIVQVMTKEGPQEVTIVNAEVKLGDILLLKIPRSYAHDKSSWYKIVQ